MNKQNPNNKSRPKQLKHESSGSNIRSSGVVAGVYTYKRPRKTNKIGKNCIHFNTENLTCKINNRFCTNASTCVFFEYLSSATKVIPSFKRKTKKRKKTDNFTRVGITAIVLSNNRKCTNAKHELKDINAKVRVVTTNGCIKEIVLPAAYCFECDSYFVLKSDFKKAK